MGLRYFEGHEPPLTVSHLLTPITSTIPIQVNRTTPIDQLQVEKSFVLFLNPISGRLLATPISGKGGCLGPPLEISGSYRSIFKIQTAFVSSQHDLHF